MPPPPVDGTPGHKRDWPLVKRGSQTLGPFLTSADRYWLHFSCFVVIVHDDDDDLILTRPPRPGATPTRGGRACTSTGGCSASFLRSRATPRCQPLRFCFPARDGIPATVLSCGHAGVSWGGEGRAGSHTSGHALHARPTLTWGGHGWAQVCPFMPSWVNLVEEVRY